MGHYLANFIVYTMAMTGLICFAVFVYKKVTGGSFCGINDSNILKIEETLNINPRKSFMIIRAGNERFLVASDVDKTSLISRLGVNPPQRKQRPMLPREVSHRNRVPQPANPRIEDRNNISQVNHAGLPNEIIEAIQRNAVLSEEQKSHLDEIYPKKKAPNSSIVQRRVQNPRENTVVLDFSKPKDHGLTAIREIAKKINEL